ncbi:MAG: hypothetical protein RBT45_05780, partial [Acholeplasmataceae bacterium]|nr:hypothetical protein [Acholeplasmataceae bacterium]
FDPDSQTIVVSSKATNPTEVFVHELTHKLEGTKQYSNFVRYLVDSIKTNDSLRQKVLGNRITLEAIENAYKGQIDGMDKKSKEYVILTEFVAKATSEALFTDKKSIERLVTTDKNIAEKIYDWVKSQIKKIKNPSTPEERAYLSMLKKAEKLYSDAIESEVGGVRLSDLANNNSDERFSREDLRKESMRKAMAKQLLNSESVFLDFTPVFLQKLGLKNNTLTITQIHLDQITASPKDSFNRKHDIPLTYIENDLINDLNNPMLVFNLGSNKIGIMSDKTDIDGSPIYIIVQYVASSIVNNVRIDANHINSIYGRDSYEQYINNNLSKIIYIDKQKTSNLFRSSGNIYPNHLNMLVDKTILTQIGNNVNINETVKDSQGDLLSNDQIEFFKDSKVRDSNGNLLVMYHGSNNANFNVFDSKKIGKNYPADSVGGFYFTNKKQTAQYYGRSGHTKEVYLNIKNPYILKADDNWANGSDWFDISSQHHVEQAKNNGHDGIIVEHKYGNMVLAFESNQIKNTSNLNPTSNDDIRLSIDSRGEELTKEQQEFFKDSKVLDENGNLLVVYHGTKNSSFYEFDGSTVRKDNMLGKGFYFSTSSEVASKYGNRTITAYLNLKNPFKTNNKNPYFGSSLARVFTDAELKPYINQKTGTVKTESINNLLIEKGYDGIMTDGGLIVAFKSNQIKLVENTKPTNDKDIRFSITDDRLVKKYSNIDLNQDISKLDGVPAIRLNDGSILPFTENHIPFIKNNNIDVNDIESGGWIENGQYNSSAQSDTMRYVNQQKSKQRFEELRKTRDQRFSIAEIKEKYREYTENVWMYEKDNYIRLDTIKIKKELRNQGIGTQFMKDLIGYADQENKIIGLTPSDAFGASSVSRLKDFYKRFGFKENKGRNSHMQYMETMIRMPQAMGANKTNDIRFSIYLSEDQRKILAKAGSIEYSTNKDKTGFNVQVLNSKGFLEYSGSSISVSQLYEKFGDEVAKHIKNSATNVTSTLNKSEIASYIGDELKSEDYSNIVSKAKKHFGTTQNIVTAGYINTDGSMLNFGDGHGYRIMDHRDIAEIMDLSGGDAMYKYIELGNIRIMPETGGIELSKKPTDKQLSSLSRFINYFKGEVTVDLWAASETSFNDSYNLTYVEYEEKTSSMKILNDIKKFYDEGINPSEQSDIRYSVSGTYTKQQVNKIIANRVNQKYYTRNDAEVVINTALTDIIKVPEGKVTISNKNFEQVVRELWDVLNTKQPGNRLGYALQIADYIMENAYAQKMIDTSSDRKNLELLATLNQYKKRIDLEAITQDLNTALGANKQPFNTWGKRSTTNESLTMDQVETELKANGIELKGANTIEKFIDLNKMYTDASKEVKRQINELKNELTEEERKQAQQDISRSIMNAFETKGKVSSFKKQLNTYISKISMLREQLDKAYKVNRAVNNLLATINKVEGLEKYRSVELYPLSMEIVSGIKTL